jgi:hypothetical protein
MPRAVLPSTLTGWFVTVIVAMVGFFAGFLFLIAIERLGL